MKIVNLTTHDVTLTSGPVTITFPPSGTVARVDAQVEKSQVSYEQSGFQLRLPTIYTTNAKITGLPPKPKAGVYYIVSNYVAQTARRNDLLAPNTNTAERDNNGNVVSIREFQQYLEKELVEA